MAILPGLWKMNNLNADICVEKNLICRLCNSNRRQFWIQCSGCCGCYHLSCLGSRMPENLDDWKCQNCIDQEDFDLEWSKTFLQLRESLKKILQMGDSCKSKKLVCNSSTKKLLSSALEDIQQTLSKIENSYETCNKTTRSIEGSDHRKIVESQDNPLNLLVKIMTQQQLEILPEFDGDPTMWPIFYEMFESSTKQGKFTDLDNLRRLRKCLKGEALKRVKGKLISPKCVNDVMTDLKMYYGNRTSLVTKLATRIMKIPGPDMNNYDSVINYRVELSNALSVMKHMEANQYLSDPLLVHNLKHNLSDQLRWKFDRHCKHILKRDPDEVGYEDYVNWFMDKTLWSLNECVEQDESKTDSRTITTQVVNVHKNTQLVAVCLCCKQSGHSIDSCKKFKTFSIQRRWKFVKHKHLCFMCLGKHYKRKCKKLIACSIESCGKSHHPLLHQDSVEAKDSQASLSSTGSVTHFKIIPVKVIGKNKSEIVNAMIDEGSEFTLMSAELAKRLEVSGKRESLSIGWIDKKKKRIEHNSENVRIQICGIINKANVFHLMDVNTIPDCNLDLPTPEIDIETTTKKYEHLKDIPLSQPLKKKPEILLGLNHSGICRAKDIREAEWSDLIAAKTDLGWLVYGKEESGKMKT